MKQRHANTPVLALAALGVVFGDIGTSPLYAFRQCFHNGLSIEPTHANVLGILSLILWSLILVVCVRYVGMVTAINHDGEGGILALLALVLPKTKRGVPPQATWLTFLILIGAGMLFGDGVITPAVSVLSAVEGLSVATTGAQAYIVPITVGILVALFAVQSHGTGKIGTFFGPIMVLWFAMIAALGISGIAHDPAVVAALNPGYGVLFVVHNSLKSLIVFGAVVLCVSGVEALYADLSHFGRRPIGVAWYVLVFPALLLNYLGQGALVLADPKALEGPFYALVPTWALYPVVAIATAATIIASQALISGAFTLAKQSIQLGFIPRLRVVHTSQEHYGQIYVPVLNLLLAVSCIALVLGFKSSERLANAYGLAVAVTMVVTSIAYYVVVRQRFGWSRTKAVLMTAPFLFIELLYVAGSIPKIFAGGWIPLVISAVLFVIASTWRTGRRRVAQSYEAQSLTVEEFMRDVHFSPNGALIGTAVFLTADPEGVPFVLRHHLARRSVFDERIILLTIENLTRPYVAENERVSVETLAPNLVRVSARFGFMERIDIKPIVQACATRGLELTGDHVTYYASDPVIVAKPDQHSLIKRLRRGLYIILRRNARPISATLGIPPDELAKLGIEVPM